MIKKEKEKMEYRYRPEGVCSREIIIEIENNGKGHRDKNIAQVSDPSHGLSLFPGKEKRETKYDSPHDHLNNILQRLIFFHTTKIKIKNNDELLSLIHRYSFFIHTG